MDSLDVSDPYYDRKILDLQCRYDEQYGKIEEIEIQINEVQTQIRSIRQEKISGDNIYRLLLAFDQSMPPPPKWSVRSSCGRSLSG